MIDLTKITTPFGLLDPETQKALKEHGGPYQAFSGAGEWVNFIPSWGSLSLVIRVRPEPPKPREWWLVLFSGEDFEVICHSKEDADAYLLLSRTIHVREVIE